MNNIAEMWGKIMVRYGNDYFFALPSDSLIVWIYFGFFTTLALFATAYYFYLRSLSKHSKPYISYSKSLLWPNVSLATTGLLLTFFRYEQIQVLSWRFWMYILLAAIIAYNAWFFSARRQELNDELEKEAETKRKNKWLNKRKK